MPSDSCIFCNETGAANPVVIEENGYQGRQCRRCGLIYISPRPSRSDIVNLYNHDRSHGPAHTRIGASFSGRLYARHHLAIIRQYVRQGALLEVGPGAGYFLDEAREKGFEVYGTELNPVQAHFIREVLRIPCESAAITNSFAGKRFDIVYHCDVLSHFWDPIEEFKQISRKLNNGGWVVFETGNLGDVQPRFLPVFTRFQYPDHLFFFSENSLSQLLALTGFELVAVHRYSILLQLWTIRAVKRFLRQGGESMTRAGRASPTGAELCGDTMRTRLGRLLYQTGILFLYFLRYKVGFFLPKKGRPQTLIVVARKLPGGV